MPSDLEAVSPVALRQALAELLSSDPAVRVLSYLIGNPDRMLRWAHSVGVASHPALRAAVSAVPPQELRALGGEAAEEPLFLWTGLIDILNFLGLYGRCAAPPEGRKPRVLDFGCSGGRLLRYLEMHDGVEPFAVDANPAVVEWCQLNLPRVVTLLQAGRQRLPFSDAYFDLVFAPSLFTGGVPGRVQGCFDEITRVLAPGGLLLAVTNGPTMLTTIRDSAAHQAAFGIDPAQAEELAATLTAEGRVHLPLPDAAADAPAEERDGRTFIQPGYPAARWNTTAFEVLEHIPAALRNWQDIVVLRRK